MENLRRQAWKARREFASMRPAQRRVAVGALVAGGLVLLAGLSLSIYFWRLSVRFPESPFRQPSRLYGTPTQLAVGTVYSPDDLMEELSGQGYREASGSGPLARGTYRRTSAVKPGKDAGKTDGKSAGKNAGKKKTPGGPEIIAVHLRRFPTPRGEQGGGPVAVAFSRGRVAGLRSAGRPVGRVELPPPLLASFYGPDIDERRPVTLDELPDEVVRSVLAAEDDAFYIHPGVSVTGTLRAAWKNLRGGGVQQGGSTVTQQLVKNLYLTSERTFSRKAKEAVTAVMLEMRHGKKAILEAYLNEIYWGRSGPANLVGIGAAARAYFGKDASELSLGEAATLAGMIRAPSDYSPLEHPAEARERRDYVLRRLGELGWVEADRVAAALAQPLRTEPEQVVVRRMAPYFTELAAAEARERFDLEELADEGYLLFSTITWRDQKRAEEAVAKGLAQLEPARKKARREPLQAALVSLDPRDGSILAYVGGRDYAESQFDRVSQAHRQAGSAFKPVVYAAAFAEGIATPVTVLRDSPIVVRLAGTSWRPQNNDRGFRGSVTVRAALERSLNVPTVRLALQAGLSQVVELAHEMGIEGKLEPLPALALGAFGATPVEMAQVYATLANGGLKPPVHGLATVLDRGGEPVRDDALPRLQRVVDAQAAYMVTSILQGAVERGTGQGARAAGARGEFAGKTGTTSGRRDSWFAGYSPDRVTVVWVGRDDNSPTRLSGASAALPIWGRFTKSVRPARGFARFTPPPGVVTATVDPSTGLLATELCPQRVEEVFPEWDAPSQFCTRHGQQPWVEAGLGYGQGGGYYQDEPGYGQEGGYYQGEPGYYPGVDPAAVDGGGTTVVGEVEIDTSGWNDPSETPPSAEGWGGETTGDGTIVIRPSRRAEPESSGVAPEPASPAPEEAEEIPAVDPVEIDWQGYEEAEDWSGSEPPPAPTPAAQPPSH